MDGQPHQGFDTTAGPPAAHADASLTIDRIFSLRGEGQASLPKLERDIRRRTDKSDGGGSLARSAIVQGSDYRFDDTRIVSRLVHQPWEAQFPALDRHVVTAYLEGFSRGQARIGGKRYEADRPPGSVSVSAKGRDSWRSSDSPNVVTSIFLTEERLQACANEVAGGRTIELLDRVGCDDAKAFRIVKILSDEVSSKAPMTNLLLERLVDLLCLQLVRAHSSDVARLQQIKGSGLSRSQVKLVTDFISHQLSRDFSVKELADVVGLSKFHFCTAFRAATGASPYEWLLGIRMDAAKKMLADKTLSAAQISAAVGYNSPSAFSAAFRRVVGVTPQAFRSLS